jgi:anthranilate phosphoribosyltransferase
MISDLIKKLQEKTDLTYDEINNVMTDILSGNTNIQENADFLSSLAEKEETDDELLGMLDKMQELSLKIEPKNAGTIIDMCGTGGDKLQTFNVSATTNDAVVETLNV